MNKGIWMTLIGISVAVVGAFAAIALIAKHRDCDEFDYDDMMDDDLDCDYCKPAEDEFCAQEVEKSAEKANEAESTVPADETVAEEGFEIEDEESTNN